MAPSDVNADPNLRPISATVGLNPPATIDSEIIAEQTEPVSLTTLRDRFFRPETLISFGIALFLIVFFTRRLDLDPGAIWGHVRGANFFLYSLSFVVFYGSFGLRAFRWRRMLNRAGISTGAGYRMPSQRGLLEIFLLSWFANCVVPAKLGDAYRGYLFKRESGASFSTTLGTIFAERLTDLTVLFVAMLAAALLVFGPSMPGQTEQWLLFGAALTVAVLVSVAVLWMTRTRLERRLPLRVRDKFGRMHEAIFACLRRPWGFLAISLLI
ncbi:MAG: flippase-like domain-containing protein, partial [Chloroflexota bacterium]|nr:flippase-like domain-containing protein [Chloroflexota bacterium]